MNAAPDMITAGLKMIAALGVVLVLILCLLYGFRKMTGQRMGTVGAKRIHVLESHYMGVKKSIALVHVPGKILVLGICADRINLLDTIDEDIVDTPVAKSDAKPFGSLLSDRMRRIGQRRKGKDES